MQPRIKALQAAAVLGKRDDDVARTVPDFRLHIAGVEGEQIVHRRMLGFLLATAWPSSSSSSRTDAIRASMKG